MTLLYRPVLPNLKILAAATLKYSNDSIRRLVGPLGALKRKIETETGSNNIQCATSSFYLVIGPRLPNPTHCLATLKM